MGFQTKLATIIHPNEIFPGIDVSPYSLGKLAGTISLFDGVFWCARLNRIASHNELDFDSKHAYLIKMFFPTTELKQRVKIALNSDLSKERVMLFRGQTLELLGWILREAEILPNDGKSFFDESVQMCFAKALLISGELWCLNNWAVLRTGDPTEQNSRFRGLPGFRKNLEATRVVADPSRSIGRGWGIFSKHLPRVMPNFLTEVEHSIGLTIQEYFSCLAVFLCQFVLPKKDDSIFDFRNFAKENRAHEKLRQFLKLHSISIEDIRKDLREVAPDVVGEVLLEHLRNCPILSVADGRAIIADPVSLSNLGPVGFLFRLPKELRPAGFCAFGKAIEGYCHEILRKMFVVISESSFGRIELNYSGIDVDGREFEIDAIIDDPEDVSIMEIKTAFIPEERIAVSNPEKLLQALRERYSCKAPGKLAGVGQLAFTAQRICEMKIRRPQHGFRKPKRIIPILVVSDELLSSPGIGEFLAKEFIGHIGVQPTKDGRVNYQGVQIFLPLIMTVYDLENLERTIEKHEFRNIVVGYCIECPTRFETFHDYLASDKFIGNLIAPRTPAEYGCEILDLAKVEIMVEHSDSNTFLP